MNNGFINPENERMVLIPIDEYKELVSMKAVGQIPMVEIPLIEYQELIRSNEQMQRRLFDYENNMNEGVKFLDSFRNEMLSDFDKAVETIVKELRKPQNNVTILTKGSPCEDIAIPKRKVTDSDTSREKEEIGNGRV